MSEEQEISNCRFAFKCTKTWESLSEIDSSPSVRYCDECETAVHLCTSEKEFVEHAKKNHCISYQVETKTITIQMTGVVDFDPSIKD